jgi:hypothetical protein
LETQILESLQYKEVTLKNGSGQSTMATCSTPTWLGFTRRDSVATSDDVFNDSNDEELELKISSASISAKYVCTAPAIIHHKTMMKEKQRVAMTGIQSVFEHSSRSLRRKFSSFRV